ncbi:hypothetical protein [Mucilaginibacter sp.]|jgi:hypothetical protein|uniref:hypothetical protein n=1 Tax=Mucilaginibacter sp. TaxID=1882438 RepID=UPI002C375F69|nr:hypothetical protein [Mucilaginibacter sp.]HTI57496.1 hypothetical protein [Mucilaginibacter sp.]
MKTLLLTVAIALITITIFSCGKTSVTPTTPVKVDTSTTLVGSTLIVGNWNLKKDSVFLNGASNVYTGVDGDHFKFTKYSNLYIHITSGNLVDTAIYTLSSLNLQVSWTNLYYSQNGNVVTGQSNSYPFIVTTIDDNNLVLTSNVSTPAGQRYERLTFTK